MICADTPRIVHNKTLADFGITPEQITPRDDLATGFSLFTDKASLEARDDSRILVSPTGFVRLPPGIDEAKTAAALELVLAVLPTLGFDITLPQPLGFTMTADGHMVLADRELNPVEIAPGHPFTLTFAALDAYIREINITLAAAPSAENEASASIDVTGTGRQTQAAADADDPNDQAEVTPPRDLFISTEKLVTPDLLLDGAAGFRNPELFLQCSIECLPAVLGLQSIIGGGLAAAGQNVIPTKPKKLAGATKGTSVASIVARKLLKKRLLPVALPAPTLKRPFLMVRGAGAFSGRLVPLIGYALLFDDSRSLDFCVASCLRPPRDRGP